MSVASGVANAGIIANTPLSSLALIMAHPPGTVYLPSPS
jgi:hypothetical protein